MSQLPFKPHWMRRTKNQRFSIETRKKMDKRRRLSGKPGQVALDASGYPSMRPSLMGKDLFYRKQTGGIEAGSNSIVLLGRKWNRSKLSRRNK